MSEVLQTWIDGLQTVSEVLQSGTDVLKTVSGACRSVQFLRPHCSYESAPDQTMSLNHSVRNNETSELVWQPVSSQARSAFWP